MKKLIIGALIVAGIYGTKQLKLMKDASNDLDISLINVRNASGSLGFVMFDADIQLANSKDVNIWMMDAVLILKFNGKEVQRVKAMQGVLNIEANNSSVIPNVKIQIPLLNVIDIYALGIIGFIEALSMEIETNVSGIRTTIEKKFDLGTDA